ncbi:hypothetical protein WN990_01275 [Kitasatospora purpeofusca]|uniref:hypothetical protein n=1 Tax=Kitasatospora purpeofusca TaxID=67352 RepID=UPI0030F0A109
MGLRACASQSCTLKGRGYSDQKARMLCWGFGQSINGNNKWNHLDHYLADGGYFGDAYSAQNYLWWNGTVPACT